jgi:predicted NBD/HSP70 family sugar kinase
MRFPTRPDSRRTRGSASQHAAMRRSNENTILARLRREPGLSGTAIAKKTGLAPQTVSVLLRNLESEGLIVRGKVLRGKRGQPAVPFHLKGEAAYAIGIELGWQQTNFVLLDLAGRITRGMRFTYPYPDPEHLMDNLIEGVTQLTRLVEPGRNRILGISMTQPSDLASRAWVLGATEAECQRLSTIDVPAELAERTGLSVTTHNDGTSALWAEWAFGRAPVDHDCGYVFLSTFIGGALHVDGRVLDGKGVGAGRIGAAMTSRPDGSIGALHFTSSMWALSTFLAEKGLPVPAHDVAAWNWQTIERAFAEWLDMAAGAFALALANTSAIVGVTTLIMDGTLPRPVLARLVNAIQARVDTLPIEIFDPPLVLIGLCGALAPAIGAAYRLFHERYFAF